MRSLQKFAAGRVDEDSVLLCGGAARQQTALSAHSSVPAEARGAPVGQMEPSYRVSDSSPSRPLVSNSGQGAIFGLQGRCIWPTKPHIFTARARLPVYSSKSQVVLLVYWCFNQNRMTIKVAYHYVACVPSYIFYGG